MMLKILNFFKNQPFQIEVDDINKSEGEALVLYCTSTGKNAKTRYKVVDLYIMYRHLMPTVDKAIFNYSTGEYEYRERLMSYDNFLDVITEADVEEYFIHNFNLIKNKP